MKKEYYHLSIKFDKSEMAYLRLIQLQEKLSDPTGQKYPLTTLIKMAIIDFEKGR